MTGLPRLSSRQDPVVRRFRDAARRRDDDVVLLDGEHLIHEAIAARLRIDVLLADDAHTSIAGRARAAGAAVYRATRPVLEAASPVKTPSGVVALARWRPDPIERAIGADAALAIGVVDVQDPGNLGGVVRATAALGGTGVLALDASADPGGWRALRGAMGSTFRVPVARGASHDAIQVARASGLRIAAATAGAGEAVARADLRQPLLVLLGNEGSGLPATIESQADVRLKVPMDRGVESLNVAVTAGIILFEARRQRGGSAR